MITVDRRLPDAWGALLAAVLPALLAGWRLAGSGLSLTPDSLAYLFAARTWAQSGVYHSLIDPPGTPMTVFPPLFPTLIGLGLRVTGSAEASAIVLAVACVAMASAATYALLRRIPLSPAASLLAALAVFLHPDLQPVFWCVWSEAVYIVLILAFLLLTLRIGPANVMPMAGALGVVVGLAFLTRYAALSMLPPLVIALWVRPGVGRRRRLAATMLALGVAGTIGAPWLARNHAVDGTWFGPRMPTDDTLGFAAIRVLAAIGHVLVPVDAIALPHSLVGLAALGLAGVLVLAARASGPATVRRVLPAAALVAGHTALAVYAQVSTAIDPIDVRLLSPAAVPALFVVATLLGRVTGPVPPRVGASARATVAAVVLLLASASVFEAGRFPVGPQGAAVRAAAVPAACRSGARPTFANWPEVLRYYGVVPYATQFPRQVPYRRRQRNADWPRFRAPLDDGPACLVWIGLEANGPPQVERLLGGPPGEVRVDFLGETPGVYVFRAAAH
jgi:hypothetical protein